MPGTSPAAPTVSGASAAASAVSSRPVNAAVGIQRSTRSASSPYTVSLPCAVRRTSAVDAWITIRWRGSCASSRHNARATASGASWCSDENAATRPSPRRLRARPCTSVIARTSSIGLPPSIHTSTTAFVWPSGRAFEPPTPRSVSIDWTARDSASRTATAVGGRASGDFARHAVTMSSTSGGTSRSSRSCGGRDRRWLYSMARRSPTNGGWPAIISNATTPNA